MFSTKKFHEEYRVLKLPKTVFGVQNLLRIWPRKDTKMQRSVHPFTTDLKSDLKQLIAVFEYNHNALCICLHEDTVRVCAYDFPKLYLSTMVLRN